MAVQAPDRVLAAAPTPTLLTLAARLHPAAVRQDEALRGEYRHLLAGRTLPGERAPVVFWVSGDDPDREDVSAACGLARALQAAGHQVRVLVPDRWTEPAPAGLLAAISTTPTMDAGLLPGSTVAVGWAVDQVPGWLSNRGLPVFDLLLAGSHPLAQRLRTVFHGPVRTLPAGPDRAPVDGEPPDLTGRGPITAVVFGSSQLAALEPELTRLATRYPVQVLTGQAPPAPLSSLITGRSHDLLDRRAALRRARIAVLDRPAVSAEGLVDPVVGEALTAGVLPVAQRPDACVQPAVAAAGLDRMPVYSTGVELVRLLHHGARRRDRVRLLEEVTASWSSQRPADPVAALREAVAEASSTPVPRTIGFLPDFRTSNPYQTMLYAELPGAGIRVAPVRRTDRSLVLRDRSDLTGYALHLHWSAVVVQVAPTREQARTRLEAFTEQITDLQARGGQLIWTVHNVLPHETRYLELELALRRMLAERADIVHVMCPQTVELTAAHYQIDSDRMIVLPHSSYLGMYPNTVTARQARERLGIAADDLVLLALGGIRPYRGLDTLLDAFDTVSPQHPRLRLVVAGRPSDAELAERLLCRCAERPEIMVRAEHVADDELQVYHRAADLAVLPYRRILNSGALKLAETFGLPAVAPRVGCVTIGPGSRHVLGFDPNLPGDLARALGEGIELITDPARAAAARASAMATAQAYPPQRMSASLAATLLDRVPPPPPRATPQEPEGSPRTPAGPARADW